MSTEIRNQPSSSRHPHGVAQCSLEPIPTSAAQRAESRSEQEVLRIGTSLSLDHSESETTSKASW